MFDTMTLTKATGAICGSLLVFLLGSWAAESIYSAGGHGDDRVQGYVIDTGADDAVEDTADEGPDFAELFAAADVSNGERAFRNCAACHSLVEGENKAGPYLHGVVGRDVAASQGFPYSGALAAVVDVWTPQELDAFLENPRGYAPGTTMGYAGMRKAEDRADLIAYLDLTDGITYEMPASEAAPAEEAAAEEALAEEAATEEAPAEEAPAEEAATEEAPAEEAPADEAATEEAPAEEAPAEEAAAEEAPAEEAATEEAPAEDAATEEAPAEEGATEEAPAEEAPAEEDATEEAAAASDDQSAFAVMVAAADVDAGENTFRRCAACHSVEPGQNRVGPSLHGMVGSEIASVEGFNYSDALKGLEGDWTVDKMSAWIENPRGFAPGNRMAFPGLKDEQDRANVIGYLQSLSN